MNTLEALKYQRGRLLILDQKKLPLEEHYDACRTVQEAWAAIKEMRVRGAPAIALTALLALAVELWNARAELVTIADVVDFCRPRVDYLKTSRPTAVNLFAALRDFGAEVDRGAAGVTGAGDLVNLLVVFCEAAFEDDVRMNKAIGAHGAAAVAQAVAQSARGGENADSWAVLTHCNTGSLATAGYGTALGVIRALHHGGRLKRAWCTETRPYNQGARLTAFELVYEGIPGTLITDSMAAFLMKTTTIHAVIVGADRVAANGDTANKIGTYALAVLAKEHGVPFFVASPWTSIDTTLDSGAGIPIEERPASELTHLAGHQVAAPGIQVWNPGFDITPAALITAIITEKGVYWRGSGSSFFDLKGVQA